MMLEAYTKSRARLKDENDCLELRWESLLDKVTGKSLSQKILLLYNMNSGRLICWVTIWGRSVSNSEKSKAKILTRPSASSGWTNIKGNTNCFCFL